ncbi:helix-turn-helix transcriptional regulator [Streptomyces apocyni]|uniref:helix-turn-helix transcriptional regulator n=1 Tax=Streptomyces apocyni TaxID=2654677 RepID=UPI0012EABB9C|nr:LuxR family transcriptional regulator [Streptomyces apocyni]
MEIVEGVVDRPVLVKIPGEAGIGKTRLLTEFLAWAAKNSSLRSLECTAAEDRHGTFRPLSSLPGLDDPRPRENPLADLPELADPGGAVLVVDDLHQASHALNLTLEKLIWNPPQLNLLVVLAYRPHGVANRLLAALGAAQPQWDVIDLSLGPLSAEAAAELLLDQLCGQHDMTVHQESGGNPRYLKLLAALCQGDDCRGEPLLRGTAELPREATASILADLDTLSAIARTVGSAAAVIGDAFDLELTAAVAQLDRTTVLVAVDELLALDLVQADMVPGSFRFRHRVLRGVVYRSAPEGWRLGAHARAVEALSRVPNQPTVRIAEHVERAGAGGPEAAELLTSAGKVIKLQDPETAAAWYTAALRMLGESPDSREQRVELLTAIAEGALVVGRLEESKAALDRREALLAGSVARPDGEAVAIECRARLAQFAGRYTEARTVLRQAIASRVPAADSRRLRLVLAATTVRDTGWEWSEDALLSAIGSGDHLLQAFALGVHSVAALTEGRRAVAERSASEAAQLIDWQSDEQLACRTDAVCHVAWAEMRLGHHAEAARHFARGQGVSRRHGQWQAMIPLLVGHGTVELRRGRLERAREQVNQAMKLAQGPGRADLLGMVLALRAEISLAGGATLQSLDDSRAAAEAITPDTPTWRQIRLAQAAALLAHGEPAACMAAVVDAGGGARLLDLPMWDHPRALDLFSQAALAAGGRNEAEEAAERAWTAAELLQLPAALSLAATTRARVAEKPAEALGHALRAAEIEDHPFLEMPARLLAAKALWDMGDADGAARELDAVESTAGRCGLGEAPAAARELRELIASRAAAARPPVEQHMLSQREFEIAELVSQGRTNRQIARKLEVSHKTVETHLGRIFTKLDVSSRAQIASMIGRSSVIARPRRTAAAR